MDQLKIITATRSASLSESLGPYPWPTRKDKCSVNNTNNNNANNINNNNNNNNNNFLNFH